MTDASTQLLEKATFCKAGDPFAPTLVGLPDFTTTEVCPETGSASPVTTAYPDGWYVRIMFDELLDPSFEQLSPILDEDTGEETGAFTGSIAGANPVTLQCRSVTNNQFVNVSYDGYYSPSGNRITWPVGPSIVIKPNDPTLIATNTECQVTINEGVLFDKNGEEVPASQRGPFPFTIAPITAIVLDPPVDDEEYDDAVDATVIFYDNPFVQFNTSIDYTSLCPDEDGDGNCDEERTFSIKDNEHPNEGPGYCNVSFETCGKLTDCPAGGGDTVCGRGYCTDETTPCNVTADCVSGEICNTNYAYDYVAYGLDDTQWGIGPINPVEVNRKYTLAFTAGAKLKDRCGRETTLAAPSADDLTLARFITSEFDLNSTAIVTGEIASGMKRMQWNFSNVVEFGDSPLGPGPDGLTATGAFTISPAPKILTADCVAGTCPTADLPADETVVISPFADGQPMVQGHLQMNTEYTATVKAGTVVNDFYGVPYTFVDEQVIKWKTQPAIVMTGIGVRNTGQLFSVGNNGTLTKDAIGNTTDVRFSFNASIDPDTFELADVKIEPAVPGMAITSASGCGDFANDYGWNPQCVLRLRGEMPAGTYKITFVTGAKVKDIFGVEYTQAADTSITVDIEEAPAVKQCL
jgi:hypothetical protein